MPLGVTTDLADGIAVVSFDTPALRGRALAELSTLGLLHEVKVDTGGPRRRYRMSEQAARAAGLLDEPAPVVDEPAKAAPKAPAKAAPKAKATPKAKPADKAADTPADWV